MAEPTKPNVVYHADWGSKAEKRWCARAALSADDRYTAFASETVGNLGSLIERLRTEAGPTGCAFAGFDFPIGVPASYAKRAGISSFPDFLLKLGHDEWNGFDSVCDKPDQISAYRPFYPRGKYKGRRKEDLFRGHGVSSVKDRDRQWKSLMVSLPRRDAESPPGMNLWRSSRLRRKSWTC